MNKLRVLVLMHPDLIPPESNEGFSEQDASAWKTEYDVVNTLPLGTIETELRHKRNR